jgi:AraC family transcriptional activator of pobA
MPGSRQDLYISNMSRPATRSHAYSLFGESAQLPDVMHCETIAARSALHDWELAPHRHGRLHQLLWLRAGGGTAHLDDGVHALAPMALVNVPPGDVHAFSFRPGTQGFVVTLADELLDEILAHADDARRALGRACVVRGDAAVGRVVADIAAEYGGRRPARALMLRGLCATLLAQAARSVAPLDARRVDLAESDLFRRFEVLLEQHFGQRWSVADYARALAVSPTHLSRVARAVAGQGAARHIEARVLREARRHLAYTNLRVATIADMLGFADPAHFTRVFTRGGGCSPRAFRARLASRSPAPGAASRSAGAAPEST